MRNAHVPRLKQDGHVDLVSVADSAEPPARLLIEKWGSEVPFYEDYRRMLRQEDLDAILISSPHSMHYEQARLALGRGLHVLVEKPLTITSRHARSLVDLARKKKRILEVSYQRNFQAPYVYARELIAKGRLGELRGVVSYVTQDWRAAGGWRLVPELAGGGMFMDTGSHLVASTLWVTGLDPLEVTAFMDNEKQKVDINAVVNVRFRNGAVGTLNTFGNASRHDERIAIHGSEGCLVFHLHQWQVRSVLLNGEPLKIPARIRDGSPDASFFRAIRSGGKGYEPPRFAIRVAQVSEAAYKSQKEKRPVRVAR